MILFRAIVIAVLFTAPFVVHAEVRIDITRGSIEPLPVAVTEFHGSNDQESQTGRDVSGVISADLERSGLFKPIDKGAFLQTVGRAGGR